MQFAIYPLELVRTRLAVCPMGTYRGIWDCWGQIVRKEGWSCFYRGLTPSLVSTTTAIVHGAVALPCPSGSPPSMPCTGEHVACLQCSDLIPAYVLRSLSQSRCLWCCLDLSIEGNSLICADRDPAVRGGGHHDL